MRKIYRAPKACDYGCRYRSVIAFGTARLVEDMSEKLRILDWLVAKHAAFALSAVHTPPFALLPGRRRPAGASLREGQRGDHREMVGAVAIAAMGVAGGDVGRVKDVVDADDREWHRPTGQR